MIEIKINNETEILAALKTLEQGFTSRLPLMRRLSGTMYSAVMQNFDAGGRPAWQGLKFRQGKPLNDTGHLRSSISESATPDDAIVGTNAKHAAIHHFGGIIKAKNAPYLMIPVGNGFRRVKQVTIPARPFLTLTNQDENDLVDDVQDYFRSLIK